MVASSLICLLKGRRNRRCSKLNTQFQEHRIHETCYSKLFQFGLLRTSPEGATTGLERSERPTNRFGGSKQTQGQNSNRKLTWRIKDLKPLLCQTVMEAMPSNELCL
jgi:hypothetical protein